MDMPSESDESLGFRNRLSPNEEANVRAMAIVIAGGTTEVSNQDLGVDDSWFNELYTQPQSPSLPLGFNVEQHEHPPLHANMLDEEEEEKEEEEIPLPNQMEEEGDLAAPLDLVLFNEKTRIIGNFMDNSISDTCDEVIAEREEHEPRGEPLATEGEMIDEELAAEPAPDK